MPPSLLFSFTDASGLPNTTFGSEMGIINGTDYGKKLMRDQFNSQVRTVLLQYFRDLKQAIQQYGPLFDLANKGIAAGTDLYFPKSEQTPPVLRGP